MMRSPRRCATIASTLLAGISLGCTTSGAPQSKRTDSARVPDSVTRAESAQPQSAGVVHCAGVTVRTIAVAATLDSAALADSASERIETTTASDSGTVTAVATGPVLGSMDSREVSTELACTPDGAALTATLTRSADYAGGVKKNVLWRPTVTLRMELQRPTVALAVTWRMRLSNGQAVGRAQTPPRAELTYPRTMSKQISAATR